ncbi:MAG: hypothetical protein ABSG68_15230 [Thermoguttaceae bacterium]|jgi:hypothetical protein
MSAQPSDDGFLFGRLYRPGGPERSGFLLLGVRSHAQEPPVEREVKLTPALLGVVLRLRKKMKADLAAGVPEAARGWMSREEIGQSIGRETGWPLEGEAVKGYIYKINRSVRIELDRKLDHAGQPNSTPRLIESWPRLGVRLTIEDLEIDDDRLPEPRLAVSEASLAAHHGGHGTGVPTDHRPVGKRG